MNRFLRATGAIKDDAADAVGAAADADAETAVALDGLSLDGVLAASDDNLAAASRRNNEPNAIKRASRRSPVPPMMSRARAISPVPSPSREIARSPSTPPVSGADPQKEAAPASKRMVEAAAGTRPAGLVISSPKAASTGGVGGSGKHQGVRSSLRAQALLGTDSVAPHRARDKDILRPDTPGTPLAVSLDCLSPSLVGTPLGSPTAAAATVAGSRSSEG